MWSHYIVSALGIWLMSAPSVLGYQNPARVNDWIIGPLVASFAIIAWWQITRGLRWLNVVLGGWMLLAPWVLGYGASTPGFNSMATGALIIGLSLVKGKTDKRYGGGWRSLLSSNPLHERAELGLTDR